MNDKYILDDNGNPVRCDDLIQWAAWYEKADRRVAKTKVGDVEVSTVFLALNHCWGGGEPLLFETMIFGGEHDEFCDRYTTREAAIVGHENVVNMVKGNIPAAPNGMARDEGVTSPPERS